MSVSVASVLYEFLIACYLTVINGQCYATRPAWHSSFVAAISILCIIGLREWASDSQHKEPKSLPAGRWRKNEAAGCIFPGFGSAL